MIGGVDFSKYQLGVTATAIRQAISAQGPVVTVQAFRNDGPNEFCGQQLMRCREAGTEDLSIYVLLNWDRADWPGFRQVELALEAAAPFRRELLFVAIDIETYRGWQVSDVAYRIPRVLEAAAAVRAAGLYPVAYTNKGMFETVMGGTPQSWAQVLEALPEIWFATMDRVPDLGAAAKAAPWPASKIVGEQYEAGSWGGFSFDQNVWRDDFIQARRAERDARMRPPPVPPAPAPPPADQCAELRAVIQRVKEAVA